ncbi:MAG: Wzz/FepE/Etk N-terminal domain-containing protein [Clostridia bacterium]|nr:Wzz/FepE/Etk N-terminal domain-containing protein [Clostridia bacterium]
MEKKTLEMENRENASSVIETQLSVVDIINMMLTFWWLIVILAVLVGGSTYAYSKITAVPEYNSVGTLYINTQTEQKSEDVNASALNNAKVLMPTYIEILKSKPFLELVCEDLDDKYTFKEMEEFIEIEAVEDTNLINISVDTTDAHDSYLICTSIVNNAFDEIIRVFEGGSVKLINSPEESLSALPTNSYQKGLIGAVIGAVVAMLIIFLINLFDTRVKSSEELKNKYNLPILGEVSNLHSI